jgi:hypothetical protein
VTPEQPFAQVRQRVLEEPNVEPGSGFGAVPGLRVHRRIFIMLCRGALVAKLPQDRVDALVAAGTAERFDARGDGQRMREWVSVAPAQAEQWDALADEALRYVRG